MDAAFFERLLYEEESTTLDFKKEQYRFARATDDEKSELLKDILGFANAWRRSEAYILIGVVDIRGGRGNVVGIPAADHLDDHSLQQFVNSRTNRPIRFQYEAFGFDGKQVGIIRIDQQPRPLYLKSDYGKLKKNEVYVRRGSSTDPTKPATPEEVAQMGHDSGPLTADLVVEFADIERDGSLGTKISWDTECCQMPSARNIPNYDPGGGRSVYTEVLSVTDRPNYEYYRQLAEYEFVHRLFQPVRVVVRNAGQVAANRVRAEIVIPTDIGVIVVDAFDRPCKPKRNADLIVESVFSKMTSAFLRSPGDVTIVKNEERFRVEIDCGNLQPGRRVWSEVFYIGKGESGELNLMGQLFADNLPEPKDFGLAVSVNVTRTQMTVAELRSLPEPADDH